jgi:hypothetical protein
MSKKQDIENQNNEWLEQLSHSLNSMQEGFIANIKEQVRAENEFLNSEMSETDRPSEGASSHGQEVHEMLNNVDENTKEFIQSLYEGMADIIKSYENGEPDK